MQTAVGISVASDDDASVKEGNKNAHTILFPVV